MKIDNITILPSDIFIVARARSGMHWMAFLAGTLLYQTNITWINVEKYVPCIYHHGDEALLLHPPPRLLWAHCGYRPSLPKVIYMIRDPRDTCISQYHHDIQKRNIALDMPFDEYLDWYLYDRDKWAPSWDEHVRGWTSHADDVENGFFLCKYEDLLEDTFAKTKELVEFIGIERSDEEITDAIEWCSFKNMDRLEDRQGHFNYTGQVPPEHTRKGKAGEWREVLSDKQNARVWDVYGKLMKKFDYKRG